MFTEQQIFLDALCVGGIVMGVERYETLTFGERTRILGLLCPTGV